MIPHEQDGHWAALQAGELLFRPMEAGETDAPAHPASNPDGWYSPDDLDRDERDRVVRSLTEV